MGMRQQSPIGLMMIMMDFQMISFGCFKTFTIIQNDYDVSFLCMTAIVRYWHALNFYLLDPMCFRLSIELIT